MRYFLDLVFPVGIKSSIRSGLLSIHSTYIEPHHEIKEKRVEKLDSLQLILLMANKISFSRDKLTGPMVCLVGQCLTGAG